MGEYVERKLSVESPAFPEGGWIPVEHSARGKDLSPELRLSGLEPSAVSLAVTMDDASHPLIPNFNHWVMWNIPVKTVIPGALPAGDSLPCLPGAVQGRAYGRNRYKGPKPPFHSVHTYTFTVYALDCTVALLPGSRRKDLYQAMEGHILQKATLSGKFRNPARLEK